jgi:hypothetical protein
MTLKDLTHRPTLPFTISAVDADITVDSYTSSSGFAQYLVTFFFNGCIPSHQTDICQLFSFDLCNVVSKEKFS